MKRVTFHLQLSFGTWARSNWFLSSPIRAKNERTKIEVLEGCLSSSLGFVGRAGVIRLGGGESFAKVELIADWKEARLATKGHLDWLVLKGCAKTKDPFWEAIQETTMEGTQYWQYGMPRDT